MHCNDLTVQKTIKGSRAVHKRINRLIIMILFVDWLALNGTNLQKQNSHGAILHPCHLQASVNLAQLASIQVCIRRVFDE